MGIFKDKNIERLKKIDQRLYCILNKTIRDGENQWYYEIENMFRYKVRYGDPLTMQKYIDIENCSIKEFYAFALLEYFLSEYPGDYAGNYAHLAESVIILLKSSMNEYSPAIKPFDRLDKILIEDGWMTDKRPTYLPEKEWIKISQSYRNGTFFKEE